ncbi:hypothetical protein A2926_01445 [Candidatus Giovannonibacteria bacterium RIFCSPLOWO2_01_FULL_44_40]|uniref:Uncharacterized protein n=1 Tax=Candidatus Giovannonibacteria bacterium RIFCSPHIGHO2_01_FULL_45_23 TaxID=1798325 RepID=A0A1F5VEY4_9BACT|nr:MAG: hypothetical protein A2834_01635 [Candidatus Giovannonibacteria bacterium RIFCSPHIGHO2_01_FULL_45_23]OGF75345.1 MAG: hypothetical protein A3C77_00405 [Candidatus Giovannonibacteria bacterium RIFCSPHIGHO2_02_FULL_45_13]OGF79660.1 MAG: hypothetical protein A2926_01445 [Candidatus Giovannonibacteria bacterium RIFCSPLOWO2_01_FULL_44_40]
MLVITTAISGSGRNEYLEKVKEHALSHGKKIKIYPVGDMILEHANAIGVRLTPENVLNANPSVTNSVRSAVFERITKELPRALNENHAVVINIHAMFFWKKVFQRAWDNYYVSQLNPGMFITFLDDADKVRKKLKSRKQWEATNLSLEEVMLWGNVEVETTAGWAEMMRQLHYVVPVSAPATLLHRLMFEPKTDTVYLSMPLTHAYEPEVQKKVDRLAEELHKYFIVFDPRYIDPLASSNGKKINMAIYNQVVNRDLYWLIRQSHRVIAYFPKIVLSAGVINEIREAYETQKEVWLIWPRGESISPFVTYYVHKIFRSIPELLSFLSSSLKNKSKSASHKRKE